MNRQFDVIVERHQDGWYVAAVPILAGCHTQASSLDELVDRVREAAEMRFEAEDQEVVGLEFVGGQRDSVSR